MQSFGYCSIVLSGVGEHYFIYISLYLFIYLFGGFCCFKLFWILRTNSSLQSQQSTAAAAVTARIEKKNLYCRYGEYTYSCYCWTLRHAIPWWPCAGWWKINSWTCNIFVRIFQVTLGYSTRAIVCLFVFFRGHMAFHLLLLSFFKTWWRENSSFPCVLMFSTQHEEPCPWRSLCRDLDHA